jgi:hypothetical protein
MVDARLFDFQFIRAVFLAAGDFLARKDAAGNRVHAAHVLGDFAIGDAFDFERMEFAELGDLLECERGVVDQPDGCRLRHEDFGHKRLVSPEKRKTRR